MPTAPDRDRQRRRLAQTGDCRFVPPEEFRALLLSRRRLERADDAAAHVRGLRDRTTGRRFLVAEESLAAEG